MTALCLLGWLVAVVEAVALVRLTATVRLVAMEMRGMARKQEGRNGL